MRKTQSHLFFLLVIILLHSGCVRERKSNEELISEGIRLLQLARPDQAAVVFKEVLDNDYGFIRARLQLAKAYLAVGNFTAAEKELEKVRKQNPTSRALHIETARMMVAMRRFDDVFKQLSPYLSDKTGACDALQIAGSAYALNRDYPVSLSLLTKAVEACGQANVSADLLLAGVLAGAGRLQEAENRVKKASAQEPENITALYMLARLLLGRNDRTAALKTFDEILKVDPEDDLHAQYQIGLLYLENGDYHKAVEIGKDLTTKAPDAAESQRLLGFAYFFKEQYSDSLAPLQKSLALRPHAATHYLLGLAYFAQDKTELAMDQFQKALDLQPSFTPARLRLARILLTAKNVDQAINEVKKTLTTENNNGAAHCVLGFAYLAKNEYEDGFAELSRGLALDSDLSDIHGKKGRIALKQGMGQDTESELAAGLNLRPDPVQASLILAVQYLNRNEPQKAIASLQKEPADAISLYLIGEAHLRLNKENEATSFFLNAKAADPKFDLAYRRLASLYFNQGKQEQGIRELQTLLVHCPQNVHALLILASLEEIKGNDREAREKFLKAAVTGKAEGVMGAAYYLWRTNDRGSAFSILDESINKASANSAAFLYELKGKMLLADKKYLEALKTFTTLDRRNHQLAFEYITKTFLAMGESARAIAHIQAEIKRNPNSLGLLAELARVYLRSGNTKEAFTLAQDIIRIKPDSSAGYVTLAAIHQHKKEISKAIGILKKAPKKQDVKAALFLSSLYASQKNYASALEECEKIETVKSGKEIALFQKASILDAMGRKRDAEAEYQKLILRAPNNEMALNNLSYLFAVENRNLQQALVYATRAFILAPENDVIRDTLGFVLLKTGRVSEGLQMLKNVSDNNPKKAAFHYHLAIAYHESGQPAKAVESLLSALSLGDFPEAGEASVLLNRIKRTTISAGRKDRMLKKM